MAVAEQCPCQFTVCSKYAPGWGGGVKTFIYYMAHAQTGPLQETAKPKPIGDHKSAKGRAIRSGQSCSSVTDEVK